MLMFLGMSQPDQEGKKQREVTQILRAALVGMGHLAEMRILVQEITALATPGKAETAEI